MISQNTSGQIPKSSSSATGTTRISLHQEYYQTLLRSLPLRGSGASDPIHTLGITSSAHGAGVSTVSANLARVAAGAGMNILLVDTNSQRPTIHKLFGVERGPGLAETLRADGDSEKPVQNSGLANLSLLTVGDSAADFNQAFSIEKMAALIQSLEFQYDLIIFDLEEPSQGGVTLSLSSLLQGVILVLETEKTRWEAAARTKELLLRSGTKLLGTVMNKRIQRIPKWLDLTL